MNTQPSNSAPEWMRTAGAIAVIVGILGFVASTAVGGGGTLGGAIIAGMLNPLFFVGVPLGLYWLHRGGAFAPSSETYGKPPIRMPAPLAPVQPKPVPLPPPASIQPKPVSASNAPVPATPVASGYGSLIISVAIASVIIGAILGSYLTFVQFESASHTSTPSDSDAAMATHQTDQVNVKMVDERSTPGKSSAAISANTANRLEANKEVAYKPSDRSELLRYWTLGSTKETVLKIEGTPASNWKSLDTETWNYYGGSEYGTDWVTFDKRSGRVIEWTNFSGILHCEMLLNGKVVMADTTAISKLRLGSSKEEVVRARGTPQKVARETVRWREVEIWTYDTFDTVTFDANGRVLSLR